MLNGWAVHSIRAALAEPCAAMLEAFAISNVTLDIPALTAADVVTQGAESLTHMLIISCPAASSCCSAKFVSLPTCSPTFLCAVGQEAQEERRH